ncbi:MAG: hypothetical protein HC923_00920 [Myxococcales bacterium]|nr:hypothetical protein [Myxococcales bacterium]
MSPSEIRAWIAAGVTVFAVAVAGFGWVHSLVDDVEELKARQEVLADRMDDERDDVVGTELRRIDRCLTKLCAAVLGANCAGE